jgi:archaeal chaperonin
MSEERKNGREAQISNIRAAVNIAETVRSTLGPAGMDKMLVDEQGHTIVTNDGVTILRELDTAHPGAKMMVGISQTQEQVCKDGTTSVVVLGGQMLALSEGLLLRGIHPQTIVRAYNSASQIAMKGVEGQMNTGDELAVAKTALRGKAAESHLDDAAGLCVEVARAVEGDLDRVRIITQAGSSMKDSYWNAGLVLSKDFAMPTDDNVFENARVLMLDGGLEGYDLSEVQMQVNDPAQLQAIKQQEMQMLGHAAQEIAELCDVLFVRDGVHEAVVKYLSAKGVGVVSRLQQSDIDALTRITGKQCYHHYTDAIGEEIKPIKKSCIKRERIGDLDYVSVIVPKATVVTMVVRGATRQTLEEYERAFDDALGVVCLYMSDTGDGVLAGGGAALSKASVAVRKHAQEQSGLSARERMCLEAYADSLEIIPAAIANNAGMDPLDVVMELRSCPSNHGLFINDEGVGSVCDTFKEGVVEPTQLVRQIITSATEVATAILRIDDIVARKG